MLARMPPNTIMFPQRFRRGSRAQQHIGNVPLPGVHDKRCTASVTVAVLRPLSDEPASPPRLNSCSRDDKCEHGSCQTSPNHHVRSARRLRILRNSDVGAGRRGWTAPIERMQCISAVLCANIASRLAYSRLARDGRCPDYAQSSLALQFHPMCSTPAHPALATKARP